MTIISKLGNSIGIRFPRNVAACAGLKAGDHVYVRLLDSGDILVRTVEPQPQASLIDQNGSKPQVPARATEEKW